MPVLKIKLHQSLRIKGEPHEFSTSLNSGSIIDIMRKMLSNQPKILDLCLANNGKKPGILYLSENTELGSLGLLEAELEDDLEIRIVPILHGGNFI